MSTREYIEGILSRLPEKPGVYQHIDKDGTVIYVGKAKNLKRRVSSYFQKDHDSTKTRQLVAHIADIRYVVVDSEQDAFLLENNLIKQYQPRYNILLKDGKTYPSICITREPYPRIFKTRNIVRGAGEYYGPYSFSYIVDMVLELIHKLYPIRTCNLQLTEAGITEGRYKVCLKYHLGNCCGICENRPEAAMYKQWIEEARKIIRGDAHEISKSLQEEMHRLAEEMRYEEAQRIKEKLDLLEQFNSKTIITNTHTGDMDVFGYEEQEQNVYIAMLHVHRGSIVQGQTIEYKKQLEESKEEVLAMGMKELRERLGSTTKEVVVPFIPDVIDETMQVHIALSGDKKRLLDLAMQNVNQYKADRLKQADKLNPEQRATRILGELQRMLGMERMPMWIDSFDNSNIQGTNAVAGCVVFKHGKPSKSDYKRFEIKTVVGADDYASMREVVYRRYKRLVDEDGGLPDLIIADGGIGQMHAIREAVEEQLGLHIPIAGLKKDSHHRTQTLLFGEPAQEVSMPVTSEVFRLLVSIQDEVHRFAISYHKKKRSKHQISSQLNEIQGVGEKTKELLLKHYGSVRAISSAELAELQELIGNSRGIVVYEYFRGKISR